MKRSATGTQVKVIHEEREFLLLNNQKMYKAEASKNQITFML